MLTIDYHFFFLFPFLWSLHKANGFRGSKLTIITLNLNKRERERKRQMKETIYQKRETERDQPTKRKRKEKDQKKKEKRNMNSTFIWRSSLDMSARRAIPRELRGVQTGPLWQSFLRTVTVKIATLGKDEQ